jgi:dephospho-CoA kinase
MLKVGLTGSIAVGKSFVCDVFREQLVPVLDADQTAREVVEPNTVGWKAIVEHFGASILQANNEIDRAKLGSIVFADSTQRELLNSIVHPLVFEAQDAWLIRLELKNIDRFAIIDAALMLESNGYQRFDKIIVVWCESEIQLERLMKRNNLTRDDAQKRINAQFSQDKKKSFADYLIDTSEGFEATKLQVIELYKQLSVL